MHVCRILPAITRSFHSQFFCHPLTFSVIFAATEAVTISLEELFYSQFVSAGVLCFQPSCHISFHLAAILKSLAIKLLSQCGKQMAVLQHQIRAMCRIFQDSFVTKLYAMLTYFVTDISLCLAYPSSTNTCVYSCYVLN